MKEGFKSEDPELKGCFGMNRWLTFFSVLVLVCLTGNVVLIVFVR